jgi:hypothetical protein
MVGKSPVEASDDQRVALSALTRSRDRGEVDRIGLRLQLRKQQAEAGDIVLLYGDESEALTHPYLASLSRASVGEVRRRDKTTWERMKRLADDHPWPEQRFAVKHPRWEPYAGMPLVRFCAGGTQ